MAESAPPAHVIGTIQAQDPDSGMGGGILGGRTSSPDAMCVGWYACITVCLSVCIMHACNIEG